MDEKELIKKINKLKYIKPDDNWKNSYRQVLYSQISGGQSLNEAEVKFGWKTFFGDLLPKNIMINLSRPASIIGILLVAILCAGYASVYASRDSKPGDSLYIAKMISEKTQQAITFNDKEKAKLGLEFAANRAKEITQVLDETKVNNQNQNEKVEKLSQSFKNEIKEVKNHLSKINLKAGNINKDNKAASNTDMQVFGANLGKDTNGMEIAEPKTDLLKVDETAPVAPATGEKENNPAVATSTDEKVAEQTVATPDKILDEAEKLFDEKNYNGTIDKLQEINNLIDKSGDDKGEVKGVSENSASSTEGN